MSNAKPDLLLIGPSKPVIVNGLEPHFTMHKLSEAKDREAFFAEIGPRIRAIASAAPVERINGELMSRFPKLEIVSNFGVGYDHIDAAWAGDHGITVTNTPDVLNEEVADTAIGLLLCTVREFPQADRYVRAGHWLKAGYRLTPATLRNRTVGMVGMGRIGRAIARRLDAFGVPVVYHTRNQQHDVGYHYYQKLIDMAHAVDTLMVIVPGGAATQHLINADILAALGPNGILINMARGSVVDEQALIKALKDRTIMSAGLDVFANEPRVPQELIEMEHIVLFPHLGSASVHTRQLMDQLVVDNLIAWVAGKPPLTPVQETPWLPDNRVD